MREATQEKPHGAHDQGEGARGMTTTAPPRADPTPEGAGARRRAAHGHQRPARAADPQPADQRHLHRVRRDRGAVRDPDRRRLAEPRNITNIVLQYSYILVLAIGMVIVIIAGHIDLSVGSVVALTGAVSAILVIQQGPAVVGRRPRRARGRHRGRRLAGLLGGLRRHPGVHRHPRRHAALPRPDAAGARQHLAVAVPGASTARSPTASSTVCSAATATTRSPC